MTSPSTTLAHAPAVLPPNLLPEPTARALDGLFAQLDRLGRLELRTNRVVIDRDELTQYLTSQLPREFAKRVLHDLDALPEPVLTKGDASGLVPIRWSTLLARLGPFDPQPDLTYPRLGISDTASPEDVRAALQRRDPGLPDAIFDPDRLRALAAALVDTTSNGVAPRAGRRGFVRCLVRHLGLLATIAVIAVITPILAVLLAAPPSAVAAAAIFAALGIGANVVGVLVGCLLNPNLA